MKKIIAILAAAALLLGAAALAEENDLLARIQQKGEIVVATAAAHTPQWNTPMNRRSSTILVRDEMIR